MTTPPNIGVPGNLLLMKKWINKRIKGIKRVLWRINSTDLFNSHTACEFDNDEYHKGNDDESY